MADSRLCGTTVPLDDTQVPRNWRDGILRRGASRKWSVRFGVPVNSPSGQYLPPPPGTYGQSGSTGRRSSKRGPCANSRPLDRAGVCMVSPHHCPQGLASRVDIAAPARLGIAMDSALEDILALPSTFSAVCRSGSSVLFEANI